MKDRIALRDPHDDDVPDVEAFAAAHADLHRVPVATRQPPAPRAHAADDPHHQQEVARFNREQPPAPIPPRSSTPTVPGLVALAVLGGRVIRRLD